MKFHKKFLEEFQEKFLNESLKELLEASLIELLGECQTKHRDVISIRDVDF